MPTNKSFKKLVREALRYLLAIGAVAGQPVEYFPVDSRSWSLMTPEDRWGWIHKMEEIGALEWAARWRAFCVERGWTVKQPEASA